MGLVLATLILTHLIPGGVIGIVVDDTLCHKRGAKVAFGGIFLDAVLSSKRHKTLRFGLNWVVLGIAVPIPFRTDRLLLPAGALAALPQQGTGPATRSVPRRPRHWRGSWPEANPERDVLAVRATVPYVNAAVLQD